MGQSKDPGNHSAVCQSKNEKIEDFLRRKYDFRFNTVKSKPEFRESGGNEPFQPVRKFDLNSFKRRIDTSTSAENIRRFYSNQKSEEYDYEQNFLIVIARRQFVDTN